VGLTAVPAARRVLAIDGGGSKTDVVLAGTDGRVLARVAGPASQHQLSGLDSALQVLDDLVEKVRVAAELAPGGPVADHAAIYLAGLDLPSEFAAVGSRLRARGWAPGLTLDNDVFAVLAAGTRARDAVAVVCGTGTNCAGRNAAGEVSRFAALGEITGDWGGGHHLGQRALWHAVRAEDGRGPDTLLRQSVAAHFGRPDALGVGVAVHLKEIADLRLSELAPLVFAAADAGDAVAGRLVDHQAAEIVSLATVSMRRLGLLERPVDLVLGGGVARARHPRLMTGVRDRLDAVNPRVEIVVVEAAPVVGAALLGLDALGAGAAAAARLRATLTST
jgi:N-acetylglucosamine kinase-like BadF-type ATPase